MKKIKLGIKTIVILVLINLSVYAGTVTLAWDPSPDTNVVSYYLYSGGTSGFYTNKLNVGNVLLGSIDGLLAGRTYYFTATAANNENMESDFSNEVVYNTPLPPPPPNLPEEPPNLRVTKYTDTITIIYTNDLPPVTNPPPPVVTCDEVLMNMSTNSGFGYTRWLDVSSRKYAATPFVWTNNTAICELTAALQSVGGLQGQVYASIWLGGTNPVTQLGESTAIAINSMPHMDTFSLSNAIVSKTTFPMPNVACPVGTHWLVLRGEPLGSSAVNNLLWWRNGAAGGAPLQVLTSSDGMNWSLFANRRGLHTISALSE